MTASIQTHGMKQMLTELRQLEPELHKQIRSELVVSAMPFAAAVGAEFPETALQNWQRKRSRSGKARLPAYHAGLARKGVKPVYSTSTRRNAILRVEQKNAGGQVYDSAGSRSDVVFVRNLDKHLRTKSRLGKSRSRVMYAGAKKNMAMVEKPVKDILSRIEKHIQNKIVGG